MYIRQSLLSDRSVNVELDCVTALWGKPYNQLNVLLSNNYSKQRSLRNKQLKIYKRGED